MRKKKYRGRANFGRIKFGLSPFASKSVNVNVNLIYSGHALSLALGIS